jgi:hypothetical protein
MPAKAGVQVPFRFQSVNRTNSLFTGMAEQASNSWFVTFQLTTEDRSIQL